MASQCKRIGGSVAATFAMVLLCGFSVKGQAAPAGVRVEMDAARPLFLKVTLKSGAETHVDLYQSRLPWGSRYSMVLVAATADGRSLPRELVIDDPSPRKVSLEPNRELTGDIDLQNVFRGLNQALKRSDIILFWAYEAPEELHLPRWSGGWLVVPRRN